jgi:hypothetical protein
MKTKIIIGVLVLSLFGFAVVMNPHKEMHVQKINDLIEKPLKNSDSTFSIMEEMMFDRFVEIEVDYYNYWFYSIGYYHNGIEPKKQRFGIFGKVFIK